MHTVRVITVTQQISFAEAKILRQLLADGRTSEEDISKITGIPKQAVKANIKKMGKEGIITGATIHINYRLFDFKAVAHIIITFEPSQAEELSNYLQKMPEIYGHSSNGSKGQTDVVAILRTLAQLSEIKDNIKRKFSVLEMKTAIWTDVKEMNYNLAIVEECRVGGACQVKGLPPASVSSISIDAVDQKIVDALTARGRISMASLADAVGVSSKNAKKRYERLRDNGLIKVTVQVNPQKIGYKALCIFFTGVLIEKLPSVIDRISHIPDVISIMKTTGDYDLQIYAMIQNLDQMLSIKEVLAQIDGISKMDFEISRFSPQMAKWPSPRQYISTF
ncbi:MAG: Lrp/AsnC family transcriptional regulator [Candidatus Bathyarchaeota archaeon]|nr:Lrp/AsnC family transcriptional regulator [Candidatus Bathyarchaeota archaeon]